MRIEIKPASGFLLLIGLGVGIGAIATLGNLLWLMSVRDRR